MKTIAAQIVEKGSQDQKRRAAIRIRCEKTFLRVLHLRLSLLLCIASVTMSGMPAYSQASPADGPWSGWVQCDHDVQAPGYQRRETQTWKLASHTPVGMNGTIMNLYSATWEATGGGKINRSDGQRTFTGQWTLKVPPTNIQMAIFVRPDGKLIIRQWGERQRAEHAVTGLRQVTTSGAPPLSLDINHAVWEWIFPVIQESPTSTHVSGSNGTETQGAHAELMPQFAPQRNATCKWEFARGANASVPPPPGDTTASNPPGTNPPGSNPPAGNPPGSQPGTGAKLLKVEPNSIEQGAYGTLLTLTGDSTHWNGTPQVTVEPSIGVPITITQTTSATTLLAQLDPQYSAALGPRTVTVTSANEVVSLPNAFTLTARAQPTLLQISPNTGAQGQQNIQVQITGKNTRWEQGKTTVQIDGAPLGPNQPSPDHLVVQSVTVHNSTSLTAVVNIDPARGTGTYAVTVSNLSPVTDILGDFNGFTVTPGSLAPPVITQVTPNAGAQGTNNFSVALTGNSTHFVQGTTTADFGPGVTLAALTVNSATSATALLNIDPQATGGPHTVTVKTGTETVTLSNGFTVNITLTSTLLATPISLKKPAITLVSPNSAELGLNRISVTLTVENMTLVQDQTHVNFGVGFAWWSVTVTSPHSATAVLTFDPSTQYGPRAVGIFNDAGESATLQNGFTLTRGTGRYRIALNGFRVNSETNAGLFGEHNAVYAAAAVEVLNRESNGTTLTVLQTPAMVRSRVHGDTRNDAGRVQAGSASATGGLVAGDVVPAGQDPASTTLPPNTFSFPLLLWQGQLSDRAEVVVVRPTVWVWNGRATAFDYWAPYAQNQRPDGGKTLDQWEMSTIWGGINNADLTPFTGHALLICYASPIANGDCTPGADRPIGLTLCYPTDTVVWCDLAFVVTREAIEKALSSPYQSGGVPKGVVPIHLSDYGSAWNGNYDLYLRVERIP